MRTYNFAPLYRSTVGFDRLFDLLEEDGRTDWPPYNIEKSGLVRKTVDPTDRRSVLISCTPAGHGHCSRFTGAATPHKKADKSKA